jgi:hypothetical protein
VNPANALAAALLLLVTAGCTGARTPVPVVPVPDAPFSEASVSTLSRGDVADLVRALAPHAETHRVAELSRRTLNHRSLWNSLGPIAETTPGMHLTEIGRSVQGRALFAVDYGRGPVRVLLWSQMHGNEPTATLALADLFRYIAENPDDPRVRRLHERLTVVAVPMLNPDGAERNRRENASGIDLNRDARRQSTPEARALATLHARISPHFGFNLHDQAPRAGPDGRIVAISLLAPPQDRHHSDDAAFTRAKQLIAVMRMAADSLVDGRVTRYDDTFNPQAFGDAMQSWGTSTVLIETGSWENDADKEYLRRVNFVLLLLALDSIATGSYLAADLEEYDTLPGHRAAHQD